MICPDDQTDICVSVSVCRCDVIDCWNYHQAGADGILIHSKLSQATEVLEFAHEWENRSALVIVPTIYYSTPTDTYRNANISLVIWANHMVRAAVASMEKISADIYANESVIDVEDNIAPVRKLFYGRNIIFNIDY